MGASVGSKLTIFQTADRILSQLQTKWASDLNPVITNPSNQSLILPKVILVNGTNVINHRLGRVLQGWRIVRQNAVASLYDSQDTNQTPDLTLVLVSNAAVTVSIEVF